MAIKDFIKRFKSESASSHIRWKTDPIDGIAFILDEEACSNSEALAIADPLFGMQYTYLKGLEEQGMSERFKNGFLVYSRFITEQDEQFAQLFDLPPLYQGKYQARIEGNTAQSKFQVDLDLILPDGATVSRYSIQGPLLKLGENEWYRIPTADFIGLEGLKKHQSLSASERTEYANNWLVFELQTATSAGMNLDLAQFRNLEVVHPNSIGVSMDLLSNGDLRLSPSFGPGINPDDVRNRLGQFSSNDKQAILRVKNKFVLLNEERINAAEEILTQKTIPRDQIAQFLKTPTAYLDAALIDLDTGFSLRVEGAERYTHHYFGEVEQSGTDWFATVSTAVEPVSRVKPVLDTNERIDEFEVLVRNAEKTGSDSVNYEGTNYDISSPDEVASTIADARQHRQIRDHQQQDKADLESPETSPESAVVAIKRNDEEADFGEDGTPLNLVISNQSFNRENLKREPFPHQEEGIQWLLAHFDLASQKPSASGALLADDMGLGKTYMILVAIAELMRRRKQEAPSPQKPTLVVAPLSLLENWQAEVDQTFIQSPFKDVVILQTGADLNKYRLKGAQRETQQTFTNGDMIESSDEIRYALKVGKNYGIDRLDMPERLVLTTFQTLRDYQFSLSRIDWSVASFDEAQNLKNPNAMATIAAKAIKAEFKLLATGTPVENSLKDFWCLMDTAVPGLLNSWQDFRTNYVAPITDVQNSADIRQIKIEIGKKLRLKVGDYMLRRTKAEKLHGLPQKRIFTGDNTSSEGEFVGNLAGMMKGSQLQYYDDIVEKVHSAPKGEKQGVVLASLHQMKIASIHHGIAANEAMPTTKSALLKEAEASSKIRALLRTLIEIEGRGEKVLIFAISKSVQAFTAALIQTHFGVTVNVINGDTSAISLKKPDQTRKGILDSFQAAPGFGAIVMSPVAAGVGLTVVGANNVIHLERHWNPAKEAQATDRVYRIGQQKDVNVYLPIALHPDRKSFDQHLSSLLANKIDLSDAVVSIDTVAQDELMDCF